MCIQIKKRGAPVKWDTSELVKIGDVMTIKKAKTPSNVNSIYKNGRDNGKKLSINLGATGGARVELMSFIEKK